MIILKDWYIDNSDRSESKLVIWEKKTSSNTVGILLTKYDAPGFSLEDFAELQINTLPDMTEDYDSISTQEIIINGIPSWKHTFTNIYGQTLYNGIKIYIVDNGVGWTLSFNVPNKSFELYESAFNSSHNSFLIIE